MWTRLPVHYVVAEWLGMAGLDGGALADTPTRRLIEEGPTARVYRITLDAGAATESHTHAVPGLTVLATPGVVVDAGARRRRRRGPGRWTWRNAGYHHALRNEGAVR
jgi:quercetin dioxygenase-like cupin family protein